MTTELDTNQQPRAEGEKDTPPESDNTRSSFVSIRILCLHDAHSNAKRFHQRLRRLDERLYLKHGIEFVYINAPLVVIEEEMESEDRRRVWWESTEGHPYLGLDASLLHIQQIWKTMPFSGILAAGQGATIASLLPMLEPGVNFAVFIHGHALLEEDEAMMANWPCLHVLEESQSGNPKVQRLVTQLPGQIHVSASQTLTNVEWNVIGKFLVEQKKQMRASGAGEELVLQTQLHFVEQEAERIIAKAIAENPPNALLAVIQPNAEVSGWSGPKRRAFGAEGGGAPCPPEFLLKREKRSAHPNGPDRHHPSASIKKEEDLS